MLSLSKKKRDSTGKTYAVWSPTATGKTMLAVNLAYRLQLHSPTALVDLSPDNALHTWTNCQDARGLRNLLHEGDKDHAYTPLGMPGLFIYTQKPGDKQCYAGEASLLGKATKALDGLQVIYDLPVSFVLAANALSFADAVVLVADHNIHSTLLLQRHIAHIRDKALLVVNRSLTQFPAAADPGSILKMEPVAVIPDLPVQVCESVLRGAPLAFDDAVRQFDKILEALKSLGK